MTNLPFSQMSRRLDALSFDAWSMHSKGVARMNNGEDIILLTWGDPDFHTPNYINEVVLSSLLDHRTHYSPSSGEPRLRETLARLESRNTGRDFTANQFSVFNGATGTLYAILSCIADEGDNIVTFDPCYLGYDATCEAVGVDLRRVATQPPDFKADLDALLGAIDDRTVAVLVNTPSNPIGNLIPASDLRILAEACRSRGIWIISDEVYSLMYFEDPHVSMLEAADQLDNVIVVDGLSKSHAMSGWRIGWAYTNEELAQKLARFGTGAFFSLVQFVQDAAIRALERDGSEIAMMRDAYRDRRDYTMQRIAKIPSLSAHEPKAGMFVMVDTHRDSEQYARDLLDEVGITVMPGAAFGESAKSHVRIGLTKDLDVLEKAWDRIENWELKSQKASQHGSLSLGKTGTHP